MVVTPLKLFATLKIPKNRKNSKANSIFISQNIDLAAKTPQKRPLFSVSTNAWRADLSPRHCGRGNCVGSWKPRFWARIRPVHQSQRDCSDYKRMVDAADRPHADASLCALGGSA